MFGLAVWCTVLVGLLASNAVLAQNNRFRSRANGGVRRQSGSPSFSDRQSGSSSFSDTVRSSSSGCEPEGTSFLAGDTCESYVRCINGSATTEQCPDGLLFAPGRGYPCAYPQEQTCPLTDRVQAVDFAAPGVPGECSRAFQIFPSPTSDNDCGSYTSCVNGQGYVFTCPEAHAFNPLTMVCDYADQVPSCDVEVYLDYRCEQREFSESEVGLFVLVARPGECRRFYTCINMVDGRVLPRPAICPEFTVFDPAIGRCSDTPEQVDGCQNEYPLDLLQRIRELRAQKEQDRQQRLLELSDKLLG